MDHLLTTHWFVRQTRNQSKGRPIAEGVRLGQRVNRHRSHAPRPGPCVNTGFLDTVSVDRGVHVQSLPSTSGNTWHSEYVRGGEKVWEGPIPHGARPVGPTTNGTGQARDGGDTVQSIISIRGNGTDWRNDPGRMGIVGRGDDVPPVSFHERHVLKERPKPPGKTKTEGEEKSKKS